jgi:hypothetical protein
MLVNRVSTEASFSPNLIDSLSLRVAQVPMFRDVVIFVLTTTMMTTTRLPLHMHTRIRITQGMYCGPVYVCIIIMLGSQQCNEF